MSDGINGPGSFCLVAVFLVFVAMCFPGCVKTEKPSTSGQTETNSNRIVAASYALQYLTQRIVGDDFQVDFPATGSADPKKWSPSVEDVSLMQKSDLIVVNGPGAAYAGWLNRVTLPASKICKTTDDFDLNDYITAKDYQVVHAHGPEGEHSHPYFVPYPWLDPRLAIKQSEKICADLIRVYPEHKSEFEQSLEDLKKDLSEIAASIPTGQSDTKNKVISTNPFPKFLTKIMGLEDRHLLWMQRSDNEDQDSSIAELENLFANFPADHLVIGGQLPASMMARLEKLPVEIHKLELLDFHPESGDFLDACKRNIQKLTNLK